MASRDVGRTEETDSRLSCQESLPKHSAEPAHQGSCLRTRKLPSPELQGSCCHQDAAKTRNLPLLPAPVTPHLLGYKWMPRALPLSTHVSDRLWKGQMPPCAFWPSEAAEARPLPHACLLKLRECHRWVKLESRPEASFQGVEKT